MADNMGSHVRSCTVHKRHSEGIIRWLFDCGSDDKHISDNSSFKSSGSDIINNKLWHQRRSLQVVISVSDSSESEDVTWKKGQKAMCSTVDDINFMQCHCMYHFFSFLQLSLWTLYKSCLRTCGIIVPCTCERAAQPTDFSSCFVNCYNISCLNLRT